MIWKTPSALIYNEWENLMYSVFYAVLMMSMEGGFIAVCWCIFSLSPLRLFVSGDQH